MVFQSYALYPHMTVRQEHRVPAAVAEGPGTTSGPASCRTPPRASASSDLLDRKPAQLSGGQRQRVALARAIVRRPQAFLMDEPLSNLDAKLRVQTRAELVELQRRLAATVVYVTHDQVEAMTMGHRIAIIDGGVLQQVGAPQDVYERPANLFVARFIGNPPMNTVAGRVTSDGDGLVAELPGGRTPARRRARGRRARTVARARRDRRTTREPAVRSRGDGLAATVSVVESLGHERHIVCRLVDDQLVIVRQAAARRRAPRGRVGAPRRRPVCTCSTSTPAIGSTHDRDGRRAGAGRNTAPPRRPARAKRAPPAARRAARVRACSRPRS